MENLFLGYKNKVMTLLLLCMEAKEIGFDVHFNYFPHVNCIEIHYYGKNPDYDNTAGLGYSKMVFMTHAGAEKSIDSMIDYVKNLIGSDTNDT